MFAIGQTVKFVNVVDAGDELVRFTVVELRGDRVLVELICAMRVRPTFVYPMADLEAVA